MKLKSFSFSLKAKLLSILLLILLIPLASIRLISEAEHVLADNLKSNLLLSSKLIGLQLGAQATWFNELQLPSSEKFVAEELFVFPLEQEIKVDGFFSEWDALSPFKSQFYLDDNQKSQQNVSLLLGFNQERLYIAINAVDSQIIYSQPESGFRSDTVVISFIDQENNPKRVFIAPSQRGEVLIQQYTGDSIEIAKDYFANWQETDDGFNLEVGFPDNLKPKELRVTHFDVEEFGQITHSNRITSSRIELNPLVWPSESLNQLVQKIPLLNGQRLWILDHRGRVLSRKGQLVNIIEKNELVDSLSNWLFRSESGSVSDHRTSKTRLGSTLVFDALNGKNAALIESRKENNNMVAIVASPILIDEQIIGVVLIEENIAGVQLLENPKLNQLLNTVLAIILIILILVGWYISRVSKRIIELKKKIHNAVDEQGRIDRPQMPINIDGDEIDKLSHAFIKMQHRLYDYHDYLEKLAARLSHELRTPIAIVRSSLDNLLTESDDKKSREIIIRALQGTERLGEILTRMRQASGVKQAMQTAELELIDLCDLLKQINNGFNHSFPQYRFQFNSNLTSAKRLISADLMAELMDKLLTNAMDFSKENSPIVTELTQSNRRLILSVSNQGKTIEKKNLKKIFRSLVSIRAKENNHGSNLGLGLYLVQLIANFHGARVKAENLMEENGVKISVIWKGE